MDINHIENGTEVRMLVKRDEACAEFVTKVIEHVGECLVCEPIMLDGRAVNLAVPNIKITMEILDRERGKILRWNDPVVKQGVFRKTMKCHIVYITALPVEVNRRSHYRQYIGVKGYFRIVNSNNFRVSIRDASNNGIGLILNHEEQAELSRARLSLEAGQQITVSFSDEDDRYSFVLGCEVVRIMHNEKGYLEVGCHILTPVNSYPMYIAHKQVLERKRVLR